MSSLSQAVGLAPAADASAPLKHLTLLFLHDAPRGRVLLGLKKRGFGAGKLNGFGGKVEPGETLRAAALREMREESGLRALGARYAARLLFAFVGQRERMSVHVFLASRWAAAGPDGAANDGGDAEEEEALEAAAAAADAAGDADALRAAAPVESDEMKPQWVPTGALPVGDMWLDDRHWLPHVLAGRRVEARFLFRGHDEIAGFELDADMPAERFAGAEAQVPVPAGAPLQTSIAPDYGAEVGGPPAEGLVPVRFVAATLDAMRPPVAFRAAAAPGGTQCAVARGGTVRVRGSSSGGWVFCGIDEGGCGEHLRVAGGSAAPLAGFSGDDCEFELDVTHDGASPEVVVTFSTRAD